MARTFSRKRSVSWAIGPGASDVAIAASGKSIWTISITGTGTALERTIVRIRGACHCTLKTAAALGDGFLVGLGIGLVTEQALVAGITAVPGPLTDADWDGWMWHSVTDVRAITATIADGANAVSASARVDVDTKAMRKWHEDSVAVIGVIEVVESGAASMDFNSFTRMLLKQG